MTEQPTTRPAHWAPFNYNGGWFGINTRQLSGDRPSPYKRKDLQYGVTTLFAGTHRITIFVNEQGWGHYKATMVCGSAVSTQLDTDVVEIKNSSSDHDAAVLALDRWVNDNLYRWTQVHAGS